jgi:hypothetical protein
MFWAASGELEKACCGHGQQVPEVAIPTYATHVSEAEALYSGVLIGIAWSVVAACHSVGTQLHQPEGRSRAGKGLALSQFLTRARTDQRIHESRSFATLPKHGTRPNRCCRSDRQSGESSSGNFQSHEKLTFVLPESTTVESICFTLPQVFLPPTQFVPTRGFLTGISFSTAVDEKHEK